MFTGKPNLHSWKLQRRGAPSEKHSVYKHPIFAETPQVEIPAAGAVVTGGEYLKVPPRDETRVAHAHVHGALGRVPADGHRPLFHQVFEFTALEPRDRPRRPAHHGHVPQTPNMGRNKTLMHVTPDCDPSEACKRNKSTKGASKSKQEF